MILTPGPGQLTSSSGQVQIVLLRKSFKKKTQASHTFEGQPEARTRRVGVCRERMEVKNAVLHQVCGMGASN